MIVFKSKLFLRKHPSMWSIWVKECNNKIMYFGKQQDWTSFDLYQIHINWCKSVKRRKATLKHLRKEWL